MNKDLYEDYKAWRKTTEEEAEGTDIPYSLDCGEAAIREDFSNWCHLDKEISFEEMSELEKRFESEN